MFMTPQAQKSPAKVDKANGKGKSTLSASSGTTPPVNWAAFLAGFRAGKPFWNTARTARSSCRETLRIPCGISNKAR